MMVIRNEELCCVHRNKQFFWYNLNALENFIIFVLSLLQTYAGKSMCYVYTLEDLINYVRENSIKSQLCAAWIIYQFNWQPNANQGSDSNICIYVWGNYSYCSFRHNLVVVFNAIIRLHKTEPRLSLVIRKANQNQGDGLMDKGRALQRTTRDPPPE